MKRTRSELADMIADKLGHKPKVVDDILREFVKQLRSALKRGDKVELRGLATFTVVETPERVSGNFGGSRESVTIPAHKRVKIHLHQSLKRLVR